MKGWLPKVVWGGWTACGSDDETFEGWAVSFIWRNLVAEFCIGRRDRSFDQVQS